MTVALRGVAVVILAVSFAVLPAGCIPAPWPARPAEVYTAGKHQVLGYRIHSPSRIDYRQELIDGVKQRFYFDPDAQGNFATVVDRRRLDSRHLRHLLVLVDGIGADVMTELWQKGHFRLFHRPGVMIGTFPSITDPSFGKMFSAGPPKGYESRFFDRGCNRLAGGLLYYARAENEPWTRLLDYHLQGKWHGVMYLFSGWVSRWELRQARLTLSNSKEQDLIIYLNCSDGVAHIRGRQYTCNRYLMRLEQWLERVYYDHRGRIQIVMVSDHGNNFTRPRRFHLERQLRRAGLRLVKSLKRSGDVVLPLWGLVGYAHVYTYDKPTTQRVVELCRRLPEVELTMWRQGGCIRVAAGDEEAQIFRRQMTNPSGIRAAKAHGFEPAMYCYKPISGDPLRLAELVGQLRRSGRLGEDGFAADSVWFAATADRYWPDALHRIWDAFETNSQNPPDVLLSLGPGNYVGNPSFELWSHFASTHGGLAACDSDGFIMSTAAAVPPFVRPEQVGVLVLKHLNMVLSSRRKLLQLQSE